MVCCHTMLVSLEPLDDRTRSGHMRIAVAADHNAMTMKDHVSAWLRERDHDVSDRGAHPGGGIVDYPPLCADVGSAVVDGRADFGIILGGSGCGEQIAANKIRGVRAAL